MSIYPNQYFPQLKRCVSLLVSFLSFSCVGTDFITEVSDEVPATEVMGDSRTGMFVKKPGTSYNVKGTATLEKQGNANLILNFDNSFSSSNGPGLAVFLSSTNGRNSGSLNLGNLQRTSGSQDYSVPVNVALGDFDWVVIHCVPFNVTFGFAELNR